MVIKRRFKCQSKSIDVCGLGADNQEKLSKYRKKKEKKYQDLKKDSIRLSKLRNVEIVPVKIGALGSDFIES